jgi:septal ring factor EnvC (AmiA/AmiB activator)
LERAIEIINNRGKISEMEEVKTLLTLSQKKLEEYERKFDSMEKSWKKTEVKLERILNTLPEFNSSNNSLNR